MQWTSRLQVAVGSEQPAPILSMIRLITTMGQRWEDRDENATQATLQAFQGHAPTERYDLATVAGLVLFRDRSCCADLPGSAVGNVPLKTV